jgi:cell division protein FtsA
MAIYIGGDVWHTNVLAVGGDHITSDIAHGLRLPITQAEEIKISHGHAVRDEVNPNESFNIRPFGEEQPIEINRRELAHVIEARVEEIFSMVLQEIKRSGYDGLLPAGMVLTGGSSALPGLRTSASQTLNLPVRIAQPENLLGMSDKLEAPAFSTSIGLLKWAMLMTDIYVQPQQQRMQIGIGTGGIEWDGLKNFLRRLLP